MRPERLQVEAPEHFDAGLSAARYARLEEEASSATIPKDGLSGLKDGGN